MKLQEVQRRFVSIFANFGASKLNDQPSFLSSYSILFLTLFSRRFAVLPNNSRCKSCQLLLLTRQFYVFPCQHSFHGDCLVNLVKKILEWGAQLNSFCFILNMKADHLWILFFPFAAGARSETKDHGGSAKGDRFRCSCINSCWEIYKVATGIQIVGVLWDVFMWLIIYCFGKKRMSLTIYWLPSARSVETLWSRVWISHLWMQAKWKILRHGQFNNHILSGIPAFS